jgi:hypothetical protein
MVSDAPPRGERQIYEEIARGFRNPGYSKNAVFDPALDIRYHVGAHTCDPRGDVRASPWAEIRLLHYRFLGAKYFVGRYMARQRHLSEENLKNGWGTLVTVPGYAGARSIAGSSEEALTQRYYAMLNEQEIEDVVPSDRPSGAPPAALDV